jgi:amino acid transporter
MFVSTAALALGNVSGSDMYDWMGSLAVFGFLTAYALVALALPFARRALGQHTHLVAVLSFLTVGVMILIAVFDLKSSSDPAHARIPYIYLAYIAAGIAWYALRRKRTVSLEP